MTCIKTRAREIIWSPYTLCQLVELAIIGDPVVHDFFLHGFSWTEMVSDWQQLQEDSDEYHPWDEFIYLIVQQEGVLDS